MRLRLRRWLREARGGEDEGGVTAFGAAGIFVAAFAASVGGGGGGGASVRPLSLLGSGGVTQG